ncbi:MAG: hypothetical protein LBN07_02620 [Christensenellaceae bacterium]|jgi:hypothetical protein|nr:hypothetical protein [Christensenellaceae bacterium]
METKNSFVEKKQSQMTHRDMGLIKQIAKEAKARLKNNNYEECKCPLGPKSQSLSFMVNQTMPKHKAVVNCYDEVLYKRVCEILDSNCSINPVGELIDRRIFNGLDSESKQKYINNLNNKFRELKARYFKEHIYEISAF